MGFRLLLLQWSKSHKLSSYETQKFPIYRLISSLLLQSTQYIAATPRLLYNVNRVGNVSGPDTVGSSTLERLTAVGYIDVSVLE
ncbi:hypothetical protein PHJA_002727400 [Phtheirospermum japonicum]|uniref:Uncharacterized protein n=1 Tax=Phtheirospermum japonicum TaxID=374723 RepID=A0A830D5E8_9LAMI|nr:hypothetical protein PHJA_002727400 [Phtheirospermum japonicum]